MTTWPGGRQPARPQGVNWPVRRASTGPSGGAGRPVRRRRPARPQARAGPSAASTGPSAGVDRPVRRRQLPGPAGANGPGRCVRSTVACSLGSIVPGNAAGLCRGKPRRPAGAF